MDESSIKVNAETVLAAATRYIEDWNRRAADKKAKAIAKQMNRWFLPAKTEEQAVKRCLDPYTGVPPWEWRGSRWLSHATTLLTAAQAAKEHGDGLVCLTASDAAFLEIGAVA